MLSLGYKTAICHLVIPRRYMVEYAIFYTNKDRITSYYVKNERNAMFERIFKDVKEEFKNGATNVTSAKDQDIQKLDYVRSILREIGPNIDISKLSVREALILEQSFKCILAQALQLACCSEQAAVIFTMLAESGITQPVELIEGSGMPLKSGYMREVMGIPIDHRYTKHNLTVVGRDSKLSHFADISTWKNMTVIDTWTDGFFKKYENDETPKEIDFTRGYFKLQKLELIIRIEQSPQASEWNNIVCVLITIKKYINDHHATDLKEDMGKINKSFNDKIHLYTIFGLGLPIRHWKKETESIDEASLRETLTML
jgi:hypothetical protein